MSPSPKNIHSRTFHAQYHDFDNHLSACGLYAVPTWELCSVACGQLLITHRNEDLSAWLSGNQTSSQEQIASAPL